MKLTSFEKMFHNVIREMPQASKKPFYLCEHEAEGTVYIGLNHGPDGGDVIWAQGNRLIVDFGSIRWRSEPLLSDRAELEELVLSWLDLLESHA